MAESLRRALDALTDGEPVDWLELQATAADADEAARLADLQALEQMSMLLAGPAPAPPLPIVPTALRDEHEACSPARWGPIEVRGRLGRGAYGEVYDGWDTHLELMDLGTSVDVAQGEAPVAVLAGTPLYMAPELFEGGTPGVATEVYALGVLLYRLVSHAFPVEARTIGEVRAAHASQRLRPLRELRADLPPRFVGVVERAMARDPKDRFASASDLERALRAVDDPAGAAAIRTRRAWTGVALALAFGVGAVAAWLWGTRPTSETTAASLPALTDEQYRLFNGYMDLAFDKREAAPAEAYESLDSAYRVIRPVFPHDEVVHGVISMQAAWIRLAEADLAQARQELNDAEYQLKQSVGDSHPLWSVAAMIAARLAQREGRHDEVARQLVRAVRMRQSILGSRRAAMGKEFDIDRLAELSTFHSVEKDTDDDGLVDLVEAAVGLDPTRSDSDGDHVADEDEDHDGDGVSNRTALGVSGDPFLVIAQGGTVQPFSAMWQRRHLSEQAPHEGPPGGWSVTTSSQGLLFHRPPLGARARAMKRGFSLFVRATPRTGLALSSLDTAPIGPRFDLAQHLWVRSWVNAMIESSISANFYGTMRFSLDPVGSDYGYTTASGTDYRTPVVTPVPEPGSIFNFVAGLVSLVALRRRWN